MQDGYKEDLAYIHDVGHSDYALQSAPGILAILAQYDIREGLVVDLGCGSGLSAQELTKAGYQVLGVDLSEALIEMARCRVPTVEFRVESLFKTELSTCHAVISIGECLNYLCDPDSGCSALVELFDRIYNALIPGGVFIFDIAEPGQVMQGSTTKSFREGRDWIVLVEKEEDLRRSILTRRITTLRKVDEHYRREDVVHQMRLYSAVDVAQMLRNAGFRIQIIHQYGEFELPPAHVAFIAWKSNK
ncbi:class I SAM-dependent methyltransferase [Alkalinema pantanalense CENA528]|uniref:class I SAM-dependent methyltransferase n=1 Tax=Alkalinema pantanalense TaxID=1620705 RepID=UPI003D6DB01C